MGVFDFQHNGSNYELEAPDMDAAVKAFNNFIVQRPKQEEIPVLTDVAKSTVPGLTRGVAGLAGFPDFLGKAINAAEQKFTGETDAQLAERLAKKKAGAVIPDFLPTTQQAQSYLQSKIPGSEYQPQTVPGKIAESAFEQVPGALLGPGGLARNAAIYGLGAGALGEAGRQAAEGTGYETPVGIAASLAAPVVAAAGRRAITPFPTNAVNRADNAIMANEGVRLTAGQRTGNKRLQYLEAEAGGAADAIIQQQQEQFTRAVLRRAGIDADRARPEVIDGAFDRLGNQFNAIAARNNLTGDHQLVGDLTRVLRNYVHIVPETLRSPVVEGILGDIAIAMRNPAGVIDGRQYGAFRSQIGDLARRSGNNGELQTALYGIQRALDDAMGRSMQRAGSADFDLLRQTRREYRNLIPIAKAAEGGQEAGAEGLLSPARMRQAVVSSQGGRNYARGEGDFADLVRAGNATMTPLPNSGTKGRVTAETLFSLPGAVVGASQGGEYGGYGGAGAGGVIGALAGRTALRSGLMSRPVQGILGNQFLRAPDATALQRILGGVPSTALGQLPFVQ